MNTPSGGQVTMTKVFFLMILCATVSGCGDGNTYDVTQITLSNGVVKIGMPARDVKAILGPPLAASSHLLSCTSSTGTNADSTRTLTWVLETASRFHKRTVINELSFKATHPWEQLPGDPASNYGKDDAGWSLESIHLHVVSDRELKRYERMDQAESQ